MSQKPIIALDTSVLNRLVKDTDPEPFIAAILTGYAIRIPEMSYGEIAATRNPEVRKKLHDVCRRLLNVGMCIMPAHWIIDLHIKQFHHNPGHYNWLNVSARATIIEEEIQRGDFVNDEFLVEKQATALRCLQDEFEGAFPRSSRETGIPCTFNEWLVESQAGGGSFWNTASGLYKAAFGSNSAIDTSVVLDSAPDDATVKLLLNACPPFRAMVYAFELTHYDRSLRPINRGPAYKAKRNDQMMAVFLPYCDQFLTNDGDQLKCLREVASCAHIPVNVRSYDDFCSSLIVGS
jgi:hypothetical protein